MKSLPSRVLGVSLLASCWGPLVGCASNAQPATAHVAPVAPAPAATAAAAAAGPGEDPSAAPDARGAFEKLRTLVGVWQATTPKGRELRVTYHLVSADSVLVETYGAGSGKETITLFHLDGERLLATHYCAQGNQPRLAAVHDADSSKQRVAFSYLDATNLPDPEASHLVSLGVSFSDPDHFERVEVYREKGIEDRSALSFVRVEAKPGA